MKIIFTVTNDLSFDQRMQRICTSLATAGYEVTLVGRKQKTSRPLEEKPYTQHRMNLFFQSGKLFYIEYQIRLFFYLLLLPKAIISSVDLDTILPCLLIAKFKRLPLVFDAHEYFSEVPEVVGRPMVKKIWEWVGSFCIPKADKCYTVGNELANIFRKKYKRDFETIRNVPYRKTFSDKTNTEHPVILYQGMLNQGRGLEEMIMAMHQIEGAVLWLAGEGDLSEQLRDLVKAEQLEQKVKFLGFIPPRQLPELTQKAYIGINLLENSGLSYYYSLANKAFDYIQAGVPSIQMDFPEYRNLNKAYNTFYLLPKLTTEAIVKAIEELVSNDNLYHQLKTNCLRAGKELIWELEEQKLLDVYKNR